MLEERVASCTLRITTNIHQKTRILESFPLIIKLSPKRARFRVVLVDVGQNLFRKCQIGNSRWRFSLPRLALKRKRLLSCNPIARLALIFRHIICTGIYALLKIATNHDCKSVDQSHWYFNAKASWRMKIKIARRNVVLESIHLRLDSTPNRKGWCRGKEFNTTRRRWKHLAKGCIFTTEGQAKNERKLNVICQNDPY